MKSSTIWKNIIWILKLNFKFIPVITSFRIIASIGQTSFTLISSFVIGIIIDTIIKNINSTDKSYIIFCIIVFGISYFGKNIIDTFRNYGENLAGFKLDYVIPESLLQEKLNKLRIEKLENPDIQNKIHRYKENRYEIENVTRSIIIIIGYVLSVLFVIIPLIQIIPIPIILVFLSTIPAIFLNKNIFDKLFQLSKEVTVLGRRGGNMGGMITEPESLKEIKLLNAYKFLKNFFDTYTNTYHNGKVKIYKRWAMYDGLSAVLTGSAILFGIYQIIVLASNNQISIGQIAFYVAAITSIGGYVDGISSYFSSLAGSSTKITEMKSLLELEEDNDKDKKQLSLDNKPPSIEFKDVSFHYPTSEKNIFNGLNISIKPGEKIAIVGENGAGKTTFVKLLSNIYSTTEGSVLINGENLNNIDSNSWYENIGVLYQDYNTYNDLSAKENIALGKINEEISMEKVEDAAKKSDAFDFIESYDSRFDQILSEKYEDGIRPSTGQWQKISIARFFYRNAPVLILDEPTASIDAVSEANIFDRIYEFTQNKTVIIISHRFSTVRKADRILVFDAGKIVENGTHEELLKLGGKYANAFNLQAKGYKE